MSKIDLKPCPFCGKPGVNVAAEYATCGNLYCAGRQVKADFDAWNTRHEAAKPEQADECSYEAPFRRADHVGAMSEIMRICKKAMNKTVGEPWVALDKINRLASRQLLLMKTPMVGE